MSEPDLSTLAQRMRYAAQVLDEARAEFHNRPENDNSNWLAIAWNKGDLCSFASQWEAADRELIERGETIDELATVLMPIFDSWTGNMCGRMCREAARLVVESGWRKGDPA
jgi:hypothetical protein